MGSPRLARWLAALRRLGHVQIPPLAVLLAGLALSVGLLVWHVIAWMPSPPPPPPIPRREPPRCPPGKLAVTRACAGGTGGEVVVTPCDGSPPTRLVSGGAWELRISGPGALERLLTMTSAGEAGSPPVRVEAGYDAARPEQLYREGLLRVSAAGSPICPAPLRGEYEVVRFPDTVAAPPAPLLLLFRTVCAPTRSIVSGCLRWEPPPEAADPAPAEGNAAAEEAAEAPPAEAAGDPDPRPAASPAGDGDGETATAGSTAEPPRDPPLDRLPPCDGPRPVPVASRPRRPGPLEWLGARVPGEGDDPLHSLLPSAMDTAALARRYLKDVDLEAGLGPTWRREMARRQRENMAATDGDDPPPTALTFEIPATEVPGHLFLLDARGPASVTPTGAAGAVHFFVDGNGCERGRELFGAVHVPVRREGVLVWSPEPVAWSAPRKLVQGKDLLVREVPATAEEQAHFEVTLKWGGRSVRGRASTARAAHAYLVHADGQPILWVDWAGRTIDAVSCVGVTVYAVGETLEGVDGLVRGECL